MTDTPVTVKEESKKMMLQSDVDQFTLAYGSDRFCQAQSARARKDWGIQICKGSGVCLLTRRSAQSLLDWQWVEIANSYIIWFHIYDFLGPYVFPRRYEASLVHILGVSKICVYSSLPWRYVNVEYTGLQTYNFMQTFYKAKVALDNMKARWGLPDIATSNICCRD